MNKIWMHTNSSKGGGIASQAKLLSDEIELNHICRYIDIFRAKDNDVLVFTSFNGLFIGLIAKIFRKKLLIAFIAYHQDFLKFREGTYTHYWFFSLIKILGINVAGYDVTTLEYISETSFSKPIGLLGPKPSFIEIKKPSIPIQIIAPARFVDFKIKGLISLIDYTKKNKSYRLKIIGYGPYLNLIRSLVHEVKNIEIIGEVTYFELHKLLEESDILVGMGTTILDGLSKSNIVICNKLDSEYFSFYSKCALFSYGDRVGFPQKIEDILSEITLMPTESLIKEKSKSFELLQINNLSVKNNFELYIKSLKILSLKENLICLLFISFGYILSMGKRYQ